MTQPHGELVGELHAQQAVVAGHDVGVVNFGTLIQRAEARPPSPRPVPVLRLPADFPGLLDRDTESGRAQAALETGTPLQIMGDAGVGRTTLFRWLSHRRLAADPRDGVVSLPRHRAPVSDVLRALYDFFYEREESYAPTEGTILLGLQDTQALLLIDDLDLSSDELAELRDAVPRCRLLLTARQRKLTPGDGQVVRLPGLPTDAALALVERTLGRSLSPAERQDAEKLCSILQGNPLRIVQEVARADDEGLQFADLLRDNATAPDLGQAHLGSLDDAAKQVLGALASVGTANVGEAHIAPLAGLDLAQAMAALQQLQQRQLVQAHSPRYSLTGELASTLEAGWDLVPSLERALAYFCGWSSASSPSEVNAELDALLHLHEQAAAGGRWEDVVSLGRATDAALVLYGRWGAWGMAVDRVLEGARALGDRSSEAWALHEAGTRVLCLGNDPIRAGDLLTRALRLRESLGEADAAAVTRNNLSFLPPPSPPRQTGPTAAPPPSTWRRWVRWAVPLILLLSLVVSTDTLAGPVGRLPLALGTSTSTPTAGEPMFAALATATATTSPGAGLAVVLTSSPTPSPSPSSTQPPTQTGEPPIATATPSPRPPAETPTPAPPAATATHIPEPATEAPTPEPPTTTATPSPEPTKTPTPRPPMATATPSPQPPTETPTPEPPTATATPVPPTPSPSLSPSPATATRTSTVAPVVGCSFDTASESQMFSLLQDERQASGAPPLTLDARLVDVARAHSQDMMQAGYFSHTSPTTGSFADRLVAAGITYTTAGENIARAADVKSAFNIFETDTYHREIMQDPAYTRVGIGVCKGPPELFTLLFTD